MGSHTSGCPATSRRCADLSSSEGLPLPAWAKNEASPLGEQAYELQNTGALGVTGGKSPVRALAKGPNTVEPSS